MLILLSGRGNCGTSVSARKLERKCGTLSSGAFGRQVAGNRASEIATDGEAETGAFVSARELPVELNEGLEYRRQLVSRNSHAGVANLDPDFLAVGVTLDRYLAARRCELDRVRQQIEHYLTHFF